MIPKIIHYCWFGRGEMPELVQQCIASWHKYMPDWEYRLWNENNFDVNSTIYTQEAYEAKKYAFVSDYVRLWALNEYGGLYMDVDFEVYKPFDDLMTKYKAFAGYEGSKHLPVMMGVIASQPHGEWVGEQLQLYQHKHFCLSNEQFDLIPNTSFISNEMQKNGFISSGLEQDYKDLHILPVECFCPRLTTGEYLKTDNTYCEHKGLSSWSGQGISWKRFVLNIFPPDMRIKLIKLKRKLFS